MPTMDEILDDVLNQENPLYDDEDTSDDGDPSSEADAAVPSKTLHALELLATTGIRLSELLDNIMLGDPTIRSNKLVVAARTDIYNSSVLPQILTRVRKPPGMRVRGAAHKFARSELESWAMDASTDILRAELALYAKTTKAQATEIEVVSEESLKELNFDSIANNVMEYSPKLLELLSNICTGARQERNTQKDPRFCIVIFINALAYQLSQYHNSMQKLLCIYFKAKGVPKSVYHLFQLCGIVMSYQWSVTALSNISTAAMAMASRVFEELPCIIIHDNIRLPFPVKHQRGDNQAVTDNGTAMTIIPLRDVVSAKTCLRNSDMWEQHRIQLTALYRERRAPQLLPEDIYNLPGFLDTSERTISNILRFLFDIPQLKDSTKHMHRLLAPLKPVHQLPYGRDHISRQFMLETVPMEEQSYSGNYALMKEIPRQLLIDTDEKLHNWARGNLVPWKGDVLTTQRLRGAQRFKSGDSNSFERLEHVLPVFGWFHLDMNICNAIFYHHYAETSTSGLARDAAALRRSGLTKPTKERGPQYHTVDEFLQHTTTARLRQLWLHASGCDDIKSLAEWVEKSTPSTIRSAAEEIWGTRASNRALQSSSDDPNLCNAIALTRDLLLRHEVRDSMRHGDVGRMENALPTLLVFFAGSGSKNYAREIAEVLHWRRYEAPPGVGDLIRNECWVINTRGKADTFYPLDLRQELNNLSIKEHGPPAQGCTWAAHRKWAPALPVLTAVVQHMDENFHNFYRSRKHHIPDAEPDIKLLMARQAELNIHAYEPNRPKAERDKRTHDCMDAGNTKIFSTKYLQEIASERIRYLSYGSSMQLAEHQGMSLEEALQARIAGNMHVGNSNNNSDLRGDTTITEALGNTVGESQEEEILLYGYKEPEEQELDEGYEQSRHRLIENWGI